MADDKSPKFSLTARQGSGMFGSVLSPDHLSAGQMGEVRALLALAGQKGVLVGVQIGHAEWDMRPLILEKGSTSLVRFSNPRLSEIFPGLSGVREHVAKLSVPRGLCGVSTAGEAQGRFWIKRPYYNSVLAAQPEWWRIGSDSERSVLVRKHLELINDLKLHGLVHGHICPSNVALVNEPGAAPGPVLLDAGALLLDPELVSFWERDPGRHGMEVAPELLERQPASEASDIYGLGLILKALYQDQSLSSNVSDPAGLIARMLSPGASERPSLIDVIRVFAPGGLSRGQAARPATGQGQVHGIGAGRLISSRGGYQERKSEPPPAPENKGRVETPLEEIEDEPALDQTAEIPEHLIREKISPAAGAKISASKSSSHLTILLAILAGLFAVYLFYVRSSPQPEEVVPELSEADYLADWTSNQPSRMGKVAEVALANADSRARGIIVKEAFSASPSRPGVRLNLIKTAFDPRWERSLREKDRRVVLMLALKEVLPPDVPRKFPALSEMHPAVVLAIAGSVSLDKVPESLKSVSIQLLAGLPAPYGAAFAQLKGQGVENLGDRQAVALCQVFSGDLSEQVIAAYFSVESGQEAAQLNRLKVLYPVMPLFPGLDRQVYSFLMKNGGSIRRALSWFEGDETVKWKDVPRSQIFAILTSATPGSDLQLEHLVDLLKFPVAAVRSMAARRLAESYLPEHMFSTVSFLSSAENKLTRFQNISLVFALTSKDGEKEGALVASWFRSNPDPQAVLGLLLARKDVEKEDIFNLEAARYLAAADFETTLEQLKALAGHPETLARALAISRLDGSKADEAELLKAMAVVEPNERIRKQIQEKIAGRRK